MFIIFLIIYLIGFTFTQLIYIYFYADDIWDQFEIMLLSVIPALIWPLVIIPFITYLIEKHVLKFKKLVR